MAHHAEHDNPKSEHGLVAIATRGPLMYCHLTTTMQRTSARILRYHIYTHSIKQGTPFVGTLTTRDASVNPESRPLLYRLQLCHGWLTLIRVSF